MGDEGNLWLSFVCYNHDSACKRMVLLTHVGLASFLWDMSKQLKTRSDAAERGVWSGSPLFA